MGGRGKEKRSLRGRPAYTTGGEKGGVSRQSPTRVRKLQREAG